MFPVAHSQRGRQDRRVSGAAASGRVRRSHPSSRDSAGELLRRILAYHANTASAGTIVSRDIKTLADFRRRCPIAAYEYIEPYIERVTEGKSTRSWRTRKSTCSP